VFSRSLAPDMLLTLFLCDGIHTFYDTSLPYNETDLLSVVLFLTDQGIHLSCK
jgi:hypothetical protein